MSKFIFALMLLHFVPAEAVKTIVEVGPYVGASRGGWSTKLSTEFATGSAVGDTSGLGYGARTKFGSFAIRGGFDYMASSVSWRYNQSPENDNDDFWEDVTVNQETLSLIFNYNYSAYSGMLFVSLYDNLTFNDNTVPGKNPAKFVGKMLGLGFTAQYTDLVQIGLDYREHRYDAINIGGSEKKLPASFDGVGYKTLVHKQFFLYVVLMINLFDDPGKFAPKAGAVPN